MGWLLAVDAFVAAALAFIVEPIVAKMLLPAYGGSAAVWTTALVDANGRLTRWPARQRLAA